MKTVFMKCSKTALNLGVFAPKNRGVGWVQRKKTSSQIDIYVSFSISFSDLIPNFFLKRTQFHGWLATGTLELTSRRLRATFFLSTTTKRRTRSAGESREKH
jgi:hypothetical protein